jgi:3-deoxy-D-arabino-heptulosonate 7-phosphate (DAHP) synthase
VITSATKIGEITERAESRLDGTTNDVSFRTDDDVVVVLGPCVIIDQCQSLDFIFVLLMTDDGRTS